MFARAGAVPPRIPAERAAALPRSSCHRGHGLPALSGQRRGGAAPGRGYGTASGTARPTCIR
jgi:hypothetical protein